MTALLFDQESKRPWKRGSLRGRLGVEALAQHVESVGLELVGRVLGAQAQDGEAQVLILGWRSHVWQQWNDCFPGACQLTWSALFWGTRKLGWLLAVRGGSGGGRIRGSFSPIPVTKRDAGNPHGN